MRNWDRLVSRARAQVVRHEWGPLMRTLEEMGRSWDDRDEMLRVLDELEGMVKAEVARGGPRARQVK